jgi:hypothetical protein
VAGAEDALAVGEDVLVEIGGEFVLAELAEGPTQWVLRLRTCTGDSAPARCVPLAERGRRRAARQDADVVRSG